MLLDPISLFHCFCYLLHLFVFSLRKTHNGSSNSMAWYSFIKVQYGPYLVVSGFGYLSHLFEKHSLLDSCLAWIKSRTEPGMYTFCSVASIFRAKAIRSSVVHTSNGRSGFWWLFINFLFFGMFFEVFYWVAFLFSSKRTSIKPGFIVFLRKWWPFWQVSKCTFRGRIFFKHTHNVYIFQ